jgi:hypothetical protein
VLPRKVARLVPERSTFTSSTKYLGLENTGVGTAQTIALSLLATSKNLPQGGMGKEAPTPDIRAVGIATIPVEAGECGDDDSFQWVFGINTWERQELLGAVRHEIYIDVDLDGEDDYVVYNGDLESSDLKDGRQVTWVLNLFTDIKTRVYFVNHASNTGNTLLMICAEQIGMSASDLGTTSVNVSVQTADSFFQGPGDSISTGLMVTPGGERFVGSTTDVLPNTNDSNALTIEDNGGDLFPGNSPELGLMIMTDAYREGEGNSGGATTDTEVIFLLYQED